MLPPSSVWLKCSEFFFYAFNLCLRHDVVPIERNSSKSRLVYVEHKQNTTPPTCNHACNEPFGFLTVNLSGQIIQ